MSDKYEDRINEYAGMISNQDKLREEFYHAMPTEEDMEYIPDEKPMIPAVELAFDNRLSTILGCLNENYPGIFTFKPSFNRGCMSLVKSLNGEKVYSDMSLGLLRTYDIDIVDELCENVVNHLEEYGKGWEL